MTALESSSPVERKIRVTVLISDMGLYKGLYKYICVNNNLKVMIYKNVNARFFLVNEKREKTRIGAFVLLIFQYTVNLCQI